MNDGLVHGFAHVRSSWVNGNAKGERTGLPAFDRLLSALDGQSSFRPRTPLDMAVLVRHALRFEATRRSPEEVVPRLDMVARANLPGPEQWQAVGVQSLLHGEGYALTARPWEPDWLLPKGEAADLKAVREDFLRQEGEEAQSVDPCLRALGNEGMQYRSPGQRVAVRSALTAPPGSTLLITLPTGEGKSLVFQSLGLLEHGQGLPGVIPVIVPTVALALDHEKSIQKLCNIDRPFAYVGGALQHNRTITGAIEIGQQGLCFMAPESACGPLKSHLLQAVENGYLTSFVIDEAHLVEAWGADFRTDFLMLSALRKKMLEKAGLRQRIKTLLLSATLPQVAVDTLRNLFSEGNMGVINGARLRPELHFFAAPLVDNDTRESRVLEAVAHLPRPLILYASRPEDVDAWHQILRRNGYGNVARFHGGTSTEDRTRILDAWGDGRLDMVVGNSAFGLGIDYAHVRSVVHACMPETMDRFYQEVGRGGRDGRSSVSVLIPANTDIAIAEALNRQKIITLERGRLRWLSMFQHPDRRTLEGRHRYAVRLNVQPSNEQDDLGKMGIRSVDWNDRILTVMARAGMIHILDRYDEAGGHPWAEVEILKHNHEDESAWETINCLRAQIHANNARSLKGIKQYARGKVCPAQILSEIYTADFFTEYERLVPVCSGCPVCGSKGNGLPSNTPAPAWPWPASSAVATELSAEFDHNGLLVVGYSEAKLSTRRFRREFCEMLRGLRDFGFSNLLLLGPGRDAMEKDALDLDAHKPFFINYGTSWLARSLLPPGADIVFLLPGFVQATQLQPGDSSCERLVFIPYTLRDPSRPNTPFLETYSGANIPFETFRNKVRI